MSLSCKEFVNCIKGEIGQTLKARVTDTNKAVQSLALDIVSRIATGMGKSFDRHARLFVLPVTTVLADQKAPIRMAALQTLTAIATACESLEAMVAGFTSAMETTNPMQKGTLFHWIADWFKEHEPPTNLDLNTWASPVVSCLDDRNVEVRKGAQALLPSLIVCVGFDYVMQQTNSLKPASRTTAVPLIQAARPAAPAAAIPPPLVKSAAKPPTIIVPATSISPPPESPTLASAPVAKPGSKLIGVRRKLPQGTNRPESRAETPTEAASSRVPGKANGGIKRPGATNVTRAPAAQTPPLSLSLPFVGANLDAKKPRLGKDVQRWINEGGPTRKDLAELLQSQMESHASKELVSRLFSHDHNAVNDHISGLTTMCDFFTNAQAGDENAEAIEAVALANIDLPLKYASIKLHEPQPNLISKCLDVVEAVVAFIRSVNYQLSDAEATCFMPTIIYKVSQI